MDQEGCSLVPTLGPEVDAVLPRRLGRVRSPHGRGTRARARRAPGRRHPIPGHVDPRSVTCGGVTRGLRRAPRARPRCGVRRLELRSRRRRLAAEGSAHRARRGDAHRGRERLDLDPVRGRDSAPTPSSRAPTRTSSARARPGSRSAGDPRRAPISSSSCKGAARAGTSSRAAAHPTSCRRRRARGRSARRSSRTTSTTSTRARGCVERTCPPRSATPRSCSCRTARATSTAAARSRPTPSPLPGRDAVTWRHVGHANMIAFLKRLGATFDASREVVVSGSSAGGFGSIVELPGVPRYWPDAKAYLVDDSGPPLIGDAIPAGTRSAWYARWGIGASLDPSARGAGRTCPRACGRSRRATRRTAIALVSHLADADDALLLRDLRARAPGVRADVGVPFETELRLLGTSVLDPATANAKYFFTRATRTRRSRTRPSSAPPPPGSRPGSSSCSRTRRAGGARRTELTCSCSEEEPLDRVRIGRLRHVRDRTRPRRRASRPRAARTR